MGDSDDDQTRKPAIPTWQQAPPTAEKDKPVAASGLDAPEQNTLEQARKFLEDEEVRRSPPERKAEFLRSKGFEQGDIDQLLSEEDQRHDVSPVPATNTEEVAQNTQPPASAAAPAAPAAPPTTGKTEDRVPIITYPEFLVKPQRPPPLVTVNGFLNTLKAFGAISALIYGTSRYVLEPMANSLTEARIDLHDSANQKLGKLVEKLESTVSEIPETRKPDALGHTDGQGDGGDDDDSSYDDPSELFHRDIGVQTETPSPPDNALTGGASGEPTEPSRKAADRLAELVASVKAAKESYVQETQTLDQTRTVLDEFERELSAMAQPQNDYIFRYGMQGSIANGEADDEIKKAKENIRRVKGVLLSTRNFPASVAR